MSSEKFLYAARLTCNLVGLCCILAASIGIAYTYMVFPGLAQIVELESTPYALQAYWAMVMFAALVYLCLLFFGAHFVKLNTRWRYWFMGLLWLEVLYFVVLNTVWSESGPALAKSIVAVRSLASGGMLLNIFILFPVWGPIAILWAHRRMNPIT